VTNRNNSAIYLELISHLQECTEYGIGLVALTDY
jgi:hypothetical protein